MKFLVLASDGLWDMASDEKVVQAISAMHLNGMVQHTVIDCATLAWWRVLYDINVILA